MATCCGALSFLSTRCSAVTPFESRKFTLAPWWSSRSAAAKWLHLIALRNGVSSSVTGSMLAPCRTSRSMVSTSSLKPAAQRQYSGVEPCFRRNRASGPLPPRAIEIDAGAVPHQQVDGLHVVLEAGRPEAVLRGRALLQEEPGQRAVAAAGDRDRCWRRAAPAGRWSPRRP